jgi:hypothetical protein
MIAIIHFFSSCNLANTSYTCRENNLWNKHTLETVFTDAPTAFKDNESHVPYIMNNQLALAVILNFKFMVLNSFLEIFQQYA